MEERHLVTNSKTTYKARNRTPAQAGRHQLLTAYLVVKPTEGSSSTITMDDIVRILQNIQDDLLKQKQDMKEMEQNIKESIKNHIDEKFNLIEAKTKQLETKIEQQQKTIEFLDRQRRRKNVIFFGIEEKEKGYESLLSIVLDIINNKMEINCQKWEIENVNRMGKNSGKVRPVAVTITTTSRKLELLKKKKMLHNTNIYLNEDFTPSVLQKRKELQEDLKRERESGKRVVLRYDKIVTLKTRQPEPHTPAERNTTKRFMSASPDEVKTGNTTYSNEGGTKQVSKKNKSQTITNFLRPSQLNPSNRTIHSEVNQKN